MKREKAPLEIKGIIKKYMAQGLKPAEIGRVIFMSRQKVNYWIQIIRKEEKDPISSQVKLKTNNDQDLS